MKKLFGRKNFLVEKIFWSKRIFGRKMFLVERIFCRKKNFGRRGIQLSYTTEKKMATAGGEFNYLIPKRRKWRRAEGNSIIFYQREENGDGQRGIQLTYTKEKKMVTARAENSDGRAEFNYLIPKRRKW